MWIALSALWLGGIAAGLAGLAAYDNRPGAAAAAPSVWPAESSLSRDANGPTLVMLAHPRCTCTRASLAEFAEVMARADRPPRAFIVFLKPHGVSGTGSSDWWEHAELWRTASAIPGVTVMRDDNGLEAQRFGAQTSGQTLLYDASGRLVFDGGTTGSRGHAGDNPGRANLVALLNRHPAARDRTPVFGCPLFGSRDTQDAEEATTHGHPTS